MIAALKATAPGPYVTIQDVGRRGWRRFGVSTSGAMDYPALVAANLLVGNPPDTPCLEFGQVGGTWDVAAGSCRIAVTGGNFAISADGRPLSAWRSHTLRRGQRLVLQNAHDAVWGYLAAAGGFDLEQQLGSCAVHVRSGLGGRRLAEGDVLPLRADRPEDGPDHVMDTPSRDSGPIRVLLGPQDDYFAHETIADFLSAEWRVSHRSDRMGTWIEGPPVRHANGYNVVSDGLVPGCIQVLGSGQPVVLTMDCQTIGGYPKLATIVTADLPRFTQTPPGRRIHFTAVDIDAAQDLYRRHSASIAGLSDHVAEIAAPTPRPFWLRA
jgi:5-oxoprolinase (ATP-hydrolysing) subunit C